MHENYAYSSPIIRYLGIFGLIYAGLIVSLNVLDRGFDVNLGNAANTAILIGSVYGAASFFVRDHGRVPDARERRRLTWASVLISYAISITALSFLLHLDGASVGALLKEVNEKMTPILFGVAVIILTLIYYLFLGLCYRAFAAIALKHMKARL